MKIYTGTGDKGKTSLLSGQRVAKDHIRIEAYGVVDELSSVLGVLTAALPAEAAECGPAVQRIQSDLFRIGAWLATEGGADDRLPSLDPADSRRLEREMDALNDRLPELRAFILPGGHIAAAQAHVARTICRRAERRVITLAALASDTVSADDHLALVQVYLNRLSDYLFVLARWCNQVTGHKDQPWQP